MTEMHTSTASNIRLRDLLLRFSQKDEEWEGLKALFDRHGIVANESNKAVKVADLVDQIRRDGSHSVGNTGRGVNKVASNLPRTGVQLSQHVNEGIRDLSKVANATLYGSKSIWDGLSAGASTLFRTGTRVAESVGNVTVKALQGEGVNYDEIVADVASKLKVRLNPQIVKDERDLELLILQRVFEDYFDKLSPEERENMDKAIAKLGMNPEDFSKYFLKAGAAALVGFLAQVNGRILWQVVSGILRTIMARYAAGALAYRAIGVFWASVPFVNAVLGAWLVSDLLGPAYRKTIPTVVQIALIRLQLQYGDSEESKPKSAYTTSQPASSSTCRPDPESIEY